jgi:2-methylcitrate dehydratase
VEAAIALHAQVRNRLDDVEEVTIHTHESARRIIDKTGPLHNPADRDHCLQYMTAIGLIHGSLEADHYEDKAAADPRIDALRAKMKVVEDPRYTADYLDPEKRSIGNAVQIRFRDGTATEKAEVEYPIGHRRRRKEGIPKLLEKFQANASRRLPEGKVRAILDLFADAKPCDATPVSEFMGMWG